MDKGHLFSRGTVRLALAIACATVAFPVAADPDCTCTNRDGGEFHVGQVTCLDVDGKRYLARCEMVLNVTSWKKVGNECPTAAAGSRPRKATGERQKEEPGTATADLVAEALQ